MEETAVIFDGTIDPRGRSSLRKSMGERHCPGASHRQLWLRTDAGQRRLPAAAFRRRRAGCRIFAQWLDAAAATYAEERNVHALTFIAFKQVPWHHYARRAIEQSQLLVSSQFLDNDFVALMPQAPPEIIDSPNLALQ